MGRHRKEVDTSTYSGRLAESIRQRRERAGLMPEELAESLGVSRAIVFAWENGSKSPSIDKLPEIAAVLGISVRTLMPPE